jgi:tetratricopeptide (TPR) repeat protein
MHEEAINIINEARQIKPDSDEVAHMINALKEEMGVEQEPSAEPKSPEEALAEVEAFLSYGQIDEAMKILEDLKSADPENLEVHRKLKSLYVEFGEKELAVTECLILAKLYEKEGDTERKDHILSEAFDIDPNDPRLSDRRTAAVAEESILTPTGLDLAQPDTYTEEMSEADFYFRQGLVKEALKIYRKYAELMPDNEEIRQKIEMITAEHEPVEALQDGTGTSLQEQSGMSLEAPGEEPSKEGAADTLEGFQEISFAAKNEPVQAEEIPEPTLENDVLEIFEEFKKGIESELEEEDSDTHYNLGIAYKEMGLVDDAIKEFQTANRDPRKHIQASSMLGLCYKEKGLYPLAIEAFKNALAHIAEKDGAYWGAKFDLAEVYQKGGNLREAVALYTEIYAYDSKFRNVDEKINSLKGAIKEVPAQESSGPDAKKKKNRISYI